MSPAPGDEFEKGAARNAAGPLAEADGFEEGPAFEGAGAAGHEPDTAALIVDLGSYEGPLDLLLALARAQKVDLLQIPILPLAEQYLTFVEEARALRIELAADYLVMAAWLAYLKSRLLLPPDPEADGPSGAELAAHLAFQLQRLEAMREAAAQLMARPRKGQDFFPRGLPQPLTARRVVRYSASLLELMQAYARLRTRDEFRPYALDRDVFTMDQALERLRPLIGATPDWARLESFLPEDWRRAPARRRSATAATFAAALELVKEGRAELRQRESFAPIELRRRAEAIAGEGAGSAGAQAGALPRTPRYLEGKEGGGDGR